MPKKQSRLEKQIDARIEKSFYRTSSGIAINVMDIHKVFERGRELVAQGADDEKLGEGILAFVRTIAQE